MANCPRCGSESIQIKRDTNVDWGRAVVGTVLFGVVGGAVGAVTGEDRNANVCLNCGASWQASVLYEMLQFIKKETGKTLDLANDDERQFLNEVMQLMGKFSQEIEWIDTSCRSVVHEKKEGMMGFGGGCLVAIILAVIIGIASASASDAVAFLILGGWIFAGMGSLMTQASPKQLEDITKSYEDKKRQAEKRLKINFNQLREKYLI